MARISLWSPVKGADFNYIDKAIGENFRIAGDGILVHMYEGPAIDASGSTDTTVTSIQDVLFGENTSRKYNPNVIELRGHHVPQDVTFDLSQFGIFLSSDVIRIQFHYNDMYDALGRRLIAGDVLEFPSLRDIPVLDNAVGINRYYVVQDALYAAAGYGQKWYPHIWLIRAKLMQASPEYTEIIDQASSGQTSGGVGQGLGIMSDGFAETADSNGNPGTGSNPNIMNALNLYCTLIGLTDQIITEAAENVPFDPKLYETNNLYIYIDPTTNYPTLGFNYFSGDGTPPNGNPMLGAGVAFPSNMEDGDYYLRVDYYPERLYQKQGTVYKLVEVNVLKSWTAYNKVLDTFIDNNNDIALSDGTIIPEKTSSSQVLLQKVDLYAQRKTDVAAAEATRAAIAAQRAAKKPN